MEGFIQSFEYFLAKPNLVQKSINPRIRRLLSTYYCILLLSTYHRIMVHGDALGSIFYFLFYFLVELVQNNKENHYAAENITATNISHDGFTCESCFESNEYG